MEIGIKHVSYIENTPGVWYAIAYLLSSLVFLSSNHKKIKGVFKWVTLSPIAVFFMIFMHATTGVYGISFVLVMITVFMILYSIFALNMEGDFYKRAYYTVRSFMYGELMASIGWQVYYYGVQIGKAGKGFGTQALAMLPDYLLFVLIAVIAEKKHAKRNRETIISRRAFFTVFAIGLFIYILSNLSYVVSGTPFTTVNTLERFIIRTSLDLMAVVLFYMYHELMQQMSENIESETLKNMLQMQYSQYQISKESIDLVNRKYHDLKHQIIVLKSDIENSKTSEHLDEMLEEIKRYENQYVTGNNILDTILSAKALNCQARGIELRCVVDGEALSFIDAMDISALFGNALDNAIEGVEKVKNSNEKLIHLVVEKKKGFTSIFVENRYEGHIKFRHNLPVTNKQNTNIHGFGIKSMKNITEKYGGSIGAEAEDGWFKLQILIPYQEEKRE
ncbi:MAG: sensor histidine kinase [Butyrivibrio sp.]|uniref:GHKL domain-containing protein n=1 Tax=Butyrivibrio sp. TaxID=28121 RepID=UPI001B22175C|nr:GHKL domain-containing protein [Butyrivibrio sp.]MBO6239251.1 sensor histidine kinase [Butyrivibrio sp.]